MEIGEKFLPIGTVVMLKNGTKRVMITGFCGIVGGDKSKVWDYSGCLYPEGFLSSNQSFMFNHDQIEEIHHMGLKDEEEEKYKASLKEFLAAMNTEPKE